MAKSKITNSSKIRINTFFLKSRLTIKQIWQTFKDFLLGLILWPWIWITGFWLTINIFLQYLANLPNRDLIIELANIQGFLKPVEVFDFWLKISSILLVNYSVFFLLTKNRSKLADYIWFSTIIICTLAFLVIWPFFQQSLR